jgi:hypothetical protein
MPDDRNARINVRGTLLAAVAQLRIAEVEAAYLAASVPEDPLAQLLPQIEQARRLAERIVSQLPGAPPARPPTETPDI